MADTSDGMMRMQLDTDRLVLAELQDSGPNLGANIADAIGRSRKSVTPRLNQMADYGLVENIGRGVYRITPQGVAALERLPDSREPEDNAVELDEDVIESRAKDIEILSMQIIDHAADEAGDESEE